jgi:histidinol dehydrogenase
MPESASTLLEAGRRTVVRAGGITVGVTFVVETLILQELSRDGLSDISAAVITLAGLEGLDAHAAAVSRRLEPST